MRGAVVVAFAAQAVLCAVAGVGAVELATKAPYPEMVGGGVRRGLEEALASAGEGAAAVAKISAVVRHASRYATKPKGCRRTEEVLRGSSGPLRDWACTDDDLAKVDSISQRGEHEARGIGMRLGEAAQLLGRPADVRISVASTAARRTQQTAAVFLEGMERTWAGCCGGLTPAVVPAEQDRTLKFYDLCDKYAVGWARHKQSIKAAERGLVDPVAARVSERLGLATPMRGGDVEHVYKECLFQWRNALPAERDAADEHLCSVFDDDDLHALGAAKNLKDYHKKGPGAAAFDGHRLACVLLHALLDELQADGGGASLILRFAHAETLIPLYSLLGIGSDTHVDDYRLSHICPMASNIVLALIGRRVHLFHNEAPTPWRIPPCAGDLACPLADVLTAFPKDECVWEDMCDV